MKLSPKAMGLAIGLLIGAAVFLATLWSMAVGGGKHLILLRQFYLGYSVSFGGAFVGLVYGFIDGVIIGVLVAVLYNRFAPSS